MCSFYILPARISMLIFRVRSMSTCICRMTYVWQIYNIYYIIYEKSTVQLSSVGLTPITLSGGVLLFQGFWSHCCQAFQTSPQDSQEILLNQQGIVRLNSDIHDQCEHTHTHIHLTPLPGKPFSKVSGHTGNLMHALRVDTRCSFLLSSVPGTKLIPTHADHGYQYSV